MHYYVECIAYHTEMNSQIRNNTQKRRICCEKKVNTRLAKAFMAIFALAERLPTSATQAMLYTNISAHIPQCILLENC